MSATIIPLGTRLPRERVRMQIVLSRAALELRQVADATRGAEGMLPMAVAQVLEAMAERDPSAATDAMRGWLFELRAARGEGLP